MELRRRKGTQRGKEQKETIGRVKHVVWRQPSVDENRKMMN